MTLAIIRLGLAVEGLEEPDFLPEADRGSWDTATSRELELGGRKLLQNG